MARIVSPGVYAEETPSGVRTITGVPTSIAAFIGRASAGPIGKAVRLLSAADLDRTFGTPHPGSRLAAYVRLFFANGGTDCYVVRVVPAGATLAAADITAGLRALDGVDIFNLMVIPGDDDIADAGNRVIYGTASLYCKERKALLLADPPAAWTVNGRPAVDSRAVSDFSANFSRADVAVYYPQIKYNDSVMMGNIGPAGAMAGVIARTDSQRGIWKSPAGLDAVIRGIAGPAVNLTDVENGQLNQLGVDCVRAFPTGTVCWGARTLASGYDDEWRYIPIRRLALYIGESVRRGTQWATFEPNGEPLWAQIRLNIGAFMSILHRQGAFQGSRPEQAFYVRCDQGTTTQDDVRNGNVNIELGFAPLKPAEFMVIRIQQKAGQP
jgi:phage tail sheath protein FI